ncbi:methyltransferase domain-containing protein [Yoonia sp.]|uniref:methyltransferase domain-containing protein n=1 Tax=Yoonia sp. TaxID=2212373 RepID=UPI00358E7090
MTGMDMPQITDRAALARNRARAEPDALFLQEHAADELQERLNEVNRTFKSVAIVTGFPDFWAARYPDATIVADDETLDLKSQSYDLILHAMCLHWANDPVGQLVQTRHALKPDGLLLCTFLGGQTLHELRASLAEAEAVVAGGLSPRIAPMGEIRDLGGLLQRAGFALPVADATPVTASYVNAFHLMHDLRKMGENNALAQRIKHPTRRNVLTEAACIYADNFRNAENRVDATFEFITLTGWAPADNQPKALRPGSAKTRLADALNTRETRLDRSND